MVEDVQMEIAKTNQRGMEMEEQIVIIGAGMSGLSTALGLHKLGVRSLVLERSEDLRTTGYAFTMMNNAWKALDVLGVGNTLRQQLPPLQALVSIPADSKAPPFEIPAYKSNCRNHEFRCMKRSFMLETLAKELPEGTIRFSSKVVSIEESGPYLKLIHLDDGSTIKAKALIGCDGVNSIVAKWLGLSKPSHTGRSAIRGFVDFKQSHGFELKQMMFAGDWVRYGIIPIDETTLYWFMCFVPSSCPDKDVSVNPIKMKQYVLSKLGKVSEQVRSVIENTRVEDIICFPLIYRNPWELALWGNIAKGNVCVVGDAFHPMTPDVGQGACSSVEDGIVLARCLGRALLEDGKLDEHKRIKMGLGNYAKERRWRAFSLVATAYIVGFFEQGNGTIIKFLRDKFLYYFTEMRYKKGEFEFGGLN